ncbi:unnamed protein product, partial [Discosporangium mesarthrocarpum]
SEEGNADGDVEPSAWATAAGITEEELVTALEQGAAAKRVLVESNLPLLTKTAVEKYAWRISNVGRISIADLVQEGAYALCRAAERFDLSKDNSFLNFAMWDVQENMASAVAANSLVASVPSSALKEYYAHRRKLTDELGRKPTDSEMATSFLEKPTAGGESNASVRKKVKERRANLLTVIGKTQSLDYTLPNGEAVIDTIKASDHSDAGDGSARDQVGGLSAVLGGILTTREARLVRMVFGLGEARRTMQECAEVLCMSPTNTKKLLDATLEKLRHRVEMQELAK